MFLLRFGGISEQLPTLHLKLQGPGADVIRSVQHYNQQLDEIIDGLGIDARSESHLIWIAEMALVLPLPLPWVQYAQTETSPMCYYNPKTGIMKGRHPLWNRLLDMVHLHRSHDNPARLSVLVNWQVSDRYDEIEAAKHQCQANQEIESYIGRISRRISQDLSVWRRRSAARHQQQRQLLQDLHMSIRSRLSHVQSTIVSVATFRERTPEAFHSECDDYMIALGSCKEHLQTIADDIQGRIARIQGEKSRDEYSDSLRGLVRQQISISNTVMGEASKWMERAREEIRARDRQMLVYTRKSRAAQNTIRPSQVALKRARNVHRERLDACTMMISKTVKNVNKLKHFVARTARLINNEGYSSLCANSIKDLERCQELAIQNLKIAERHKQILSQSEIPV